MELFTLVNKVLHVIPFTLILKVLKHNSVDLSDHCEFLDGVEDTTGVGVGSSAVL